MNCVSHFWKYLSLVFSSARLVATPQPYTSSAWYAVSAQWLNKQHDECLQRSVYSFPRATHVGVPVPPLPSKDHTLGGRGWCSKRSTDQSSRSREARAWQQLLWEVGWGYPSEWAVPRASLFTPWGRSDYGCWVTSELLLECCRESPYFHPSHHGARASSHFRADLSLAIYLVFNRPLRVTTSPKEFSLFLFYQLPSE